MAAQGLQSLGLTDPGGRLTLESAGLKALDPYVILFCHDLYFCGAMRADDSNFYKYRERSISLAQFVIN